jgi:hypothetical protein
LVIEFAISDFSISRRKSFADREIVKAGGSTGANVAIQQSIELGAMTMERFSVFFGV